MIDNWNLIMNKQNGQTFTKLYFATTALNDFHYMNSNVSGI